MEKLFSFEGRIRRTEYGITYIICMIGFVAVNMLMESTGSAMLLVWAYIPLLWVVYAQGAKRCHDRGNSGWYQIIPFYVFWMLFAEGDAGENEFGPNPKAPIPIAIGTNGIENTPDLNSPEPGNPETNS